MTTRYRLLGGSIKPGAKGPYIRLTDTVAAIEKQWEIDCDGWRSLECESCRVYDSVLRTIDPTWDKWNGDLIKGPREAHVSEDARTVTVVERGDTHA